MAKISLDRKKPLTTPLRLSDDPQLLETPNQLPIIDLLERSTTGRDSDGNRMFGWELLAEGMTVVTYEQREVVVDDVAKLTCKVVCLWRDPIVEGKELGLRMDSVHGEEGIWRVLEYSQNGFRLTFTGERFL